MKYEAWGKTDSSGVSIPYPYHPLAHHSMDVAAIFGRMGKYYQGSPVCTGIDLVRIEPP